MLFLYLLPLSVVSCDNFKIIMAILKENLAFFKTTKVVMITVNLKVDVNSSLLPPRNRGEIFHFEIRNNYLHMCCKSMK